MKVQNYSNHPKFVIGYHLFTLLASFILFVVCVVHLIYSDDVMFNTALLMAVGSLILVLVAFYARVFALRAQDRVIRVEENFRHYLLTGQQLPEGLRIRQVIGLRFASDEEFPTLVQKALSEEMSEKEIKKSIKNWKGDYYRV